MKETALETESLILSKAPTSSKKCNQILVTLVIFLLITNITTIFIAIYTDVFKECASGINFESPDTPEDGNQYDYGTTVCTGLRQLWENPSIELSERNVIGRAIFQTPSKLKEAISLIKIGKRYDLGREYSPDMPFAFGRYLSTQLFCGANNFSGTCTQGTFTNALGNIGTQFDYFGHMYLVESDKSNEPDFPSNDYIIMFNNFRGSDVFNNFSGNGDVGQQYFDAGKLPMFFTKAILVDIAGYKDVDILEPYYQITADDFLNALDKQNLKLSDIGAGDVILVYTGWSEYYDTDPELYYDFIATPGLSSEVVIDIIWDTNAVIIGSDTWGVDSFAIFPAAHNFFITCGGGFLHENMKLDEWIMDARDGKAPWIGAYVFQTVPMKGSVASPGKPVVFV
eukprot:217125_1